MQKRVVAIFAMVTLVLGLGFGSALAHHNEGHAQGPPENPGQGCERSGDPEACDPGGGEDPEESPCAQLPEPLLTVCQIIVDLLGGETPEPPGGGGDNPCDQAPADLQEGCNTIKDALENPPPIPPEGGGDNPCDQAPAELQEGCNTIKDALENPPSEPPALPECSELGQLGVPELVTGCEQVRDTLGI